MSTANVPAAALPVLVEHAILGRAADAARAGHYTQAERLLMAMHPSAACRDLLARIYAQQGRYQEAEAAWREVLSLRPEDEAARAGLARLASLRAGAGGMWHAAAAMLLIALLTLAGVAAVALWTVNAVRGDRLAPPVAGVAPSPVKATPAPIAVAADGITTSQDGETTLVTFRNGLFERVLVFSAEGRQALTAVARQLQPHAASLRVEITGHSDDTPVPPGSRYRDNTSLAFARALAAMELMSGSAALPRHLFALRAAGTAPPYANSSAENRLRNRTVTLRISAAR